jgi:hypothetical protein
MKCRVPGCETVWVSILSVSYHVLQFTKYSFIRIVLTMDIHPSYGPVKAAWEEGVADIIMHELSALRHPYKRPMYITCFDDINFRKNKYTWD